MYDLTKYFIPQQFDPAKYHLEGTNTNPITGATSKVIQCASDDGKNLIFCKTLNGYPWDIKKYDANYIYDTVTELDWTNPRDYKLNGWPICPHFWDGDPSWYYYQAVAQWQSFVNCIQTGSGNVGPILYQPQGPFSMDFGGDVGIQQTILWAYYWTAPKDREQLFLTQGCGWVKWTHATLQPNGQYQLDSVSVHNKIVAGVGKPVNFPCFAV